MMLQHRHSQLNDLYFAHQRIALLISVAGRLILYATWSGGHILTYKTPCISSDFPPSPLVLSLLEKGREHQVPAEVSVQIRSASRASGPGQQFWSTVNSSSRTDTKTFSKGSRAPEFELQDIQSHCVPKSRYALNYLEFWQGR